MKGIEHVSYEDWL